MGRRGEGFEKLLKVLRDQCLGLKGGENLNLWKKTFWGKAPCGKLKRKRWKLTAVMQALLWSQCVPF